MDTLREKNQELVRRFDRWLLVLNYTPITRDMYTRTARDYLKFLGDKFVTRSGHQDVQEFLSAEAAKGIRSRTVIYKLYATRIFFDFLNLGGLVRWSPPRFVQPRLKRGEILGRPPSLTLEEVKRLFRVAKTPHERALVEVLYGTGCRPGELRTILVENVDFENHQIRVEGKSGVRVLLFTKHAEKTLRKYIGSRREGYLFVDTRPLQSFLPSPVASSDGAWKTRWARYDRRGKLIGYGSGYIPARKEMSYQEAWAYFAKLGQHDSCQRPVGILPLSGHAIEKVLEKMGVKAGFRVTATKLRHTFATHLLQNGADIRVVQELMGHKTIASTQVYTHVSKGLARESFEKFNPRARLEQVIRKAQLP
jgi:site-specific recombinase XerD